MKRVFAFLAATCAFAQVPYSTSIEPTSHEREIDVNRGSAALWQSLKKLQTRASLMMFTAHPDDEDGGMLAYESRGQGARVALLTLNRGEGGANVMSSDFFDALGLVRTMELLKAGEYYGVNQYWTRVIDYGFSKTKAESISKWTHDRVLYDVVRVVRMERPLVITSVFVGGPSDGHGNHQTAGAMAQEAFKAAGDPNMFPDQITAGLKPWTPMKDYARVPFRMRRGGGESLPANVQIPEGDYDPVLGGSYVQISREGLGYQKSQNGGGSIPKPGELASPYHRFGSTIPAADQEASFFEGIDTSLQGIATLAKGGDTGFLTRGLTAMNEAVNAALHEFSAVHPEKSASSLADGMKRTMALIEQVKRSDLSEDSKYNVLHELEIKRVQFNNALAEALGLAVNATVTPATEMNPIMAQFLGDAETFRMAIPGQKFNVKLRVVNRSPEKVQLVKTSVEPVAQKSKWQVSGGERSTDSLANDKPMDLKYSVTVPENATFTRPYFQRPDIEQSYYTVTDERFLNRPLSPYPLAGWADFEYKGAPIRMGQYVQTIQRLTGQGSVYLPLVVGPAIGVAIAPQAGIVPLSEKSFNVTAVVHSNVKGPATGTVKLAVPSGWKTDPASVSFETSDDGQDQSGTFKITPSQLTEKTYNITAVADYKGNHYTEGYSTTGYPTLMPYFLYRPATYRLSGVDVKVAPGLKVGYVMGSGDAVPASLDHLGVHVSFLGPLEIASGDLSSYDVILLGVRTYAAREDLAIYKGRLLEYVKNGGVMIVQYNTPEFDRNFGPYPYSMTNNPEEVTDEASKVQILNASNPIFNWPNKITEADFTNWVEERGSKWMKTWDSKYEPLLEAHDEGQEPQRGGLLYAKYGKGVYIYNAWSFYRQLPEGVPGAYRLFANMLSLPKNPAR